jgi:hypothetical protein
MSLRILGLLVFIFGCGTDQPEPPSPPIEPMDPGSVADMRIFFGHQSVGRDILAGIAMVAPSLRIVSLDATPDGPALIEASIGKNEHPASKDRAFLEALAGLGPVDVALYKYCYVDISLETDVHALFAGYAQTLEQAPVPVVPVTLPLTAVEPGWKRWLKRVAGRPTQAALNAKRMEFNGMLRERFADGAIVDLARLESTRDDGSRCLTRVDGADVECLVPEFSDDGSHLNDRGRVHVARAFLQALSRATSSPSN